MDGHRSRVARRAPPTAGIGAVPTPNQYPPMANIASKWLRKQFRDLTRPAFNIWLVLFPKPSGWQPPKKSAAQRKREKKHLLIASSAGVILGAIIVGITLLRMATAK